MLLAQLNIVSTQQDVSMPQVLDTRADPSPLQEEGPDGGTGDQDSRSRHSSGLKKNCDFLEGAPINNSRT